MQQHAGFTSHDGVAKIQYLQHFVNVVRVVKIVNVQV